MKKPIRRMLKISGALIIGIPVLLFLIPILFPGTVVEKTKQWVNKSIDGEIRFSKVRLSFFNHFPSLTVSLYDVVLKGSEPFRKDTLISSKEIALGINIKSLVFHKSIKIDQIFVSEGQVNIKVNENGLANYNVYRSSDSSDSKSDSTGTSLRLEKISIDDTRFIYDDRSIAIFIEAIGFNYSGSGDLNNAIFDLYSRARIDSFNMYYQNEPYLVNKKVKADLVTKINTHSLSFIFTKNRLRINRLPVDFRGKLDFLENGYDIDLSLSSKNSKLYNLVTALPPQYTGWLEKTKVRGKADMAFSLKGQYIASENRSPDLALSLNIADGFIKHAEAPLAASDILLDLKVVIPSLNTDSLHFTADSLYFNLGKDFLAAHIDIKGLSTPEIDARIKSRLDLASANKAFGMRDIDVKGLLDIDVRSRGKYDPASRSFPLTHAKASLRKAYLKTGYYPHPIEDIDIVADITNTNGSMKDLRVNIEPLSFLFEKQPFFVQARLNDFDKIIYAVKAKGEIDLGKVYRVFSQEGLDLDGFIRADLSLDGSADDATAGRYDKLNNKGSLELKNIRASSKYFPYPFHITHGLFSFDRDKMFFNDFEASYENSDFRLKGYLQNVIEYALSPDAILKGRFNSGSALIDANKFMSASEGSAATDSTATGVILIPRNYDLAFTAAASRIIINDLELKNFKGEATVKDGVLSLNNTGFNLIDCDIVMNAKYKDESPRRAMFDYNIKAKNFDIARAYSEIKLFRDLASSAAGARGIVSLDYRLKGTLDEGMHPVYHSLEGGGTLSLQDVKVKGLKLFAVMSRKAGNDSINDPSLRKVDIKTTIKDNIINIERFKFKVAGFRPRIEGQTSFDGDLNLRIRLGLPPLGIVGIPFHVTGKQDNPKFRLGKGKTELQSVSTKIDSPE